MMRDTCRLSYQSVELMTNTRNLHQARMVSQCFWTTQIYLLIRGCMIIDSVPALAYCLLDLCRDFTG